MATLLEERDQPGQVGQQSKGDAQQNDHAVTMAQPANRHLTSSGRAKSSSSRAQESIIAKLSRCRQTPESIPPGCTLPRRREEKK
jgi:hypothetical protein